jgi:hypothetical protein
VDILYQDAFEKLSLKRVDLKSYDETELNGFNGTSTHPWRYINLNVTFGEGTEERTVETSFLVVHVMSLYNCIMGRRVTTRFLLELF